MKKNLVLTLCILLTFSVAGAALAKGGDSFTNSSHKIEAFRGAELEMERVSADKAASLTFFNDSATFQAAAPDLPKETFDGGVAAPGQVVGCGSPLSSAPSPCFPAGNLLPGFEVVASSGTNVVALGPGIVPFPGFSGTSVASDLFADITSLNFTDGNTFAVGFNFVDFFGSPIVTISVFSAAGLEGQAIATSPGFFGVVSDTPITEIVIGVGTNVIVVDNLCFGSVDADGDGIPDSEDACPQSDLSETVVIDGCDSGVANTLGEDGCTISDLIGECAGAANNHGQFVSCVSHLTNDLKQAGVISGRDKGAIQRCAARSSIP